MEEKRKSIQVCDMTMLTRGQRSNLEQIEKKSLIKISICHISIKLAVYSELRTRQGTSA